MTHGFNIVTVGIENEGAIVMRMRNLSNAGRPIVYSRVVPMPPGRRLAPFIVLNINHDVIEHAVFLNLKRSNIKPDGHTIISAALSSAMLGSVDILNSSMG